jgi:SAM-dependent methyltransferase/glycosyltransferase involved in cell wall biosynthesis
MIVIDHAAYDETSIAANLGAPEYSYWFVCKAFRRILGRMATLHHIAMPDREVDAIFRAAQARGEPCAFLSFNPPQYVPLDLACPTFPVFAWEYDRIPDEVWSNNEQDDWRVALGHCGAAVTHSQSAARAVRMAMGADYRVWSIPAPVHAANAMRADPRPSHASFRFEAEGGVVIDTAAVDLSLFRRGEADELGVRALQTLRRRHAEAGAPAPAIDLDGVIYTSIFNPADGRKNWQELLAAFVWAFRSVPDATLIIKITQVDPFQGLLPVLAFLARLGRYRCRVLLVHGMLSEGAYARLIEATSFVVNSSYGEGQCLPLMEFMSAGRPAIAPRHSAMLEYVNADNAFVVESFSRLIYWPHDPREARRCHHREVSFTGLVRAYRESHHVAVHENQRYRAMTTAARIALENFCGDELVSARLRNFLEFVSGQTPAVAASPAGEAPVTPEAIEVRDRWMAGWFQSGGELYHGFGIGAGDAVLHLGGEDPPLAAFCGSAGAASVRHATWQGDALALDDGCATRIVCLDVVAGQGDPAARLSELARVGREGALYLIAVPSAFALDLEAPDGGPPAGPPLAPEHVRALIGGAGLRVVHEDRDGFFRTLAKAFAAQITTPAGEATPIGEAWARTWARTLAASDDGRIQRLFDEALPGRHLFVARKGGAGEAEPRFARPDRSWCADWPVPGRAGIIFTDPFAQGINDAARNGWFDRERGALAPGFPVSAEDVVLDFGCGGAGLMGFCAAQGAAILLADADATVLAEARASVEAVAQRPVETLVSDGAPLFLPDAVASRVVCTEVLEHVDDPASILSELVRVGAPGALYLLTVPAPEVEDMQEAIGPADYFHKPNHVRVFEESAFRALVEDAGLSVVRSSADGFFWSLGLLHLWTKGVRPGASSVTLDLWGAVWHYLLDAPRGLALRHALDTHLPKRQIIVARKAGAA